MADWMHSATILPTPVGSGHRGRRLHCPRGMPWSLVLQRTASRGMTVLPAELLVLRIQALPVEALGSMHAMSV